MCAATVGPNMKWRHIF